ncbi:MAG: hypothetical protein LJE91_16115 [Gammaproteobacteria bacterium]|jgi:hypothetical protein|nr:hypothetical protein [Gammaproteobacteria bacterium]
MFRFLPGIFIVLASTVALVLAIQNPGTRIWWITVSLIVVVISLLASFWFASIANHMHKDTVSRVKERYAKERENLRVKTEREKTRVIEESHRRVLKGANRAHAKANFKVGLAVTGAVGAGIIMLFTELLTMGLLTLSTAGGALVGYGARARQDRLSKSKRSIGAADGGQASPRIIEAEQVPRIPASGGKRER